MSTPRIHTLLENTSGALAAHYLASTRAQLQAAGMQNRDWNYTLAAYGKVPDPLSLDFVAAKSPFTPSESHLEGMRETVARGFLAQHDAQSFSLTAKGKSAMENFYLSAREAISDLEAIPPGDQERLAELMERTIRTIESDIDAGSRRNFSISRRTDPRMGAPTLVKIDQYITDYLFYRDDAHNAVWQPKGITAIAWEAFTTLWRREADSVATLAKTLSNRPFTAQDYSTALQPLIDKGWLDKQGETYRVTAAGKAAREVAEELTDDNYLVGWSQLTTEERHEAEELLERLAGGLWLLKHNALSQLAAEAMGATFPFYQHRARQHFQETGLTNTGDFYYSLSAYTEEPRLLTLDHILSNTPYYNPENRKVILEQVAGRGFLEAVEGGYRLTHSGRKGVQGFYDIAHEQLAALAPLSSEEAEQLRDLLGKIIEATIASTEPANKQHLLGSRAVDPGPDATLMAQIDQYLTDLMAYRDDAHEASWQQYDIEGYAWEAFSAVWQDQANTAEALGEQFSFRGYTADDYAAALQRLEKLGWIEDNNGAYKTTQAGNEVREAAEVETDRLYYVGWGVLSAGESVQLANLLTLMRDSLRDKYARQLADENAGVFELTGRVSQAVLANTRETLLPVYEEAGILKPGMPFALILARSNYPEPVSGSDIVRRYPYSTSTRWNENFRKLAEAGFLDEVNEGYQINERGRDLFDIVISTFESRLHEINDSIDQAVAAEELETLEGLLDRVVQAAVASNDPPGSHCLKAGQFADSPISVTLLKIDRHLDDLNAFRDDCHLAAWQPHCDDGQQWELFSMVWDKTLDSVEAFKERTQFRGHADGSHETAAHALIERGWLVSDDSLEVTDAGKALRDEAESQTNLYFYRPFGTLNPDEQQQLRELLEKLEVALTALTENEKESEPDLVAA